MQVTSMLSAGYLEPVNRISRVYSPENIESEETDVSKQQKEQEILSEEQSIKAKLGSGAQVHTVYHYSMGTDGRRYITGASVTMKGSEEDLNRVSGGVTTQEIAQKEANESKLDEIRDKNSRTVSERIKEENKDALKTQKSEQDSEEEREIQELENIQREVIAHEAAHQAAAGEFGGAVSYSYTEGPDGKKYITGGEVPIKIKEGATPEETLHNMQKVQRAANAPADPSGQDFKVAAKAATLASKARSEMTAGDSESQKFEFRASVLRNTPIFEQNSQEDAQQNILNGVSSVLASLREYQIQNQIQIQSLMPAA